MADPAAFYLPTGEQTFESTSATESPWDLAMQHGGPPAALLVRAIERTRPDADMPIARITVDMLGGIPQGRIRTEAEITRPGRRVELVQARLYANDEIAVRASAWRIRRTPGSTQDVAHPADAVPPVPPEPAEQRFFAGVPDTWGYGRAIDWRFVAGGYDVAGPATVWTRLRVPLVEGEETSPVARTMVVADSTNGLSGGLPVSEWLFIPPTVTATVLRPPAGEWMLLDARSTLGADGNGLAEGRVSDDAGPVAVVAQPLLVARR